MSNRASLTICVCLIVIFDFFKCHLLCRLAIASYFRVWHTYMISKKSNWFNFRWLSFIFIMHSGSTYLSWDEPVQRSNIISRYLWTKYKIINLNERNFCFGYDLISNWIISNDLCILAYRWLQKHNTKWYLVHDSWSHPMHCILYYPIKRITRRRFRFKHCDVHLHRSNSLHLCISIIELTVATQLATKFKVTFT